VRIWKDIEEMIAELGHRPQAHWECLVLVGGCGRCYSDLPDGSCECGFVPWKVSTYNDPGIAGWRNIRKG
jgi:hypothetical protein